MAENRQTIYRLPELTPEAEEMNEDFLADIFAEIIFAHMEGGKAACGTCRVGEPSVKSFGGCGWCITVSRHRRFCGRPAQLSR